MSELIKMHRYSHPSWDLQLITYPQGGEEVAADHLGEGEDPDLLTVEEVEMTQGEIDALPEFDG